MLWVKNDSYGRSSVKANRCTPSVITWKQVSIGNESTQLSVISTYMHGEAQTPLGRIVVDIRLIQTSFVNKFTTSQSDEA